MTVTADRTFDLETLLRRTKYSVASAARRAGVDRAQLHRYANLGMSQDEAEDLTAALGTDPGAVWDHWPADSPAPARAAATEPKAPKSDTPPQIVWEDPPAPRTGPRAGAISDIQAAALRANPGKWARIKEYSNHKTAYSAGNRIRKGNTKAGPGFETRTANVGGTGVLYARYTGQGSE